MTPAECANLAAEAIGQMVVADAVGFALMWAGGLLAGWLWWGGKR